MTNYVENPKTKGSGIICAIPQKTSCPIKCEDCFFTNGRSYLEPLEDNLPNLPNPDLYVNNIIRVNDGNDSNNGIKEVLAASECYKNKFYNTSIPFNFEDFSAPVVLTVNPGKMTNLDFHRVYPIPNNLMMVRVRTNTWNLSLVDRIVDYYRSTPVILTFMAYENQESIPLNYQEDYILRKRTLNSYYAITTDAWRVVMRKYEDLIQVYSCGKLEGEKGKTSCRYCGNCLREYFATMERMKEDLT